MMAVGAGRNALLGVAGATRKEIDTMEVLAMKNENMTAEMTRKWAAQPATRRMPTGSVSTTC